MHNSKLSLSDICLISISVALIVTLSQLSLPLPGGVPMTMQTFVISFAGVVLGAKKGTIAAGIYVLLGAIGLPVFAGFSGGFQVLFGPTGGYIFSYPFVAFIVGFCADKGRKIRLAIGLAIGTVITMSMGLVQFSVVMGLGLRAAFFIAVAPFILLEMLKMVMVFILAPSIRNLRRLR